MAGLLVAGSSSEAASPPNIIVIVADDPGYNEFGFQGNTQFLTPNLDSLAASGVRFTNGYASCPLCSPTRAGLLTGIYQQRLGHEYNIESQSPASSVGLPTNQVTLPQTLKTLGYNTGIVGKWHLGRTAGRLPNDRGFDSFYGFLTAGHDYTTEEASNPIYRNTTPDPTWANSGAYLTDAFGNEAVSFIDDHHDDANPFFLYLPFNSVHSPLEAKASDLAMFPSLTGQAKTRAAMIYAMDRAVGQVKARLAQHGIDDNTMIFFVGDNGGQNGLSPDNSPLSGFKNQTQEGGIRVPFFVNAPGLTPGVYDNPVIALDIFPTAVAAAGGALGSNLDGVNLTPYLTGQNTGAPHEMLYWRLNTHVAARKGDWKIVKDALGAPLRLYNLADDIGETTDLSAINVAKFEELKLELTRFEAQLAKPLWTQDAVEGQGNHFRFREDQVTSTTPVNFSAASIWFDVVDNINTAIDSRDSFANTILEFRTKSTAPEYTATNNIVRTSGLPFMLNKLVLSGTMTGTSNRAGTINGGSVVMVPSLTGTAPTVQLDATATSSGGFSFNVSVDIQLLGDLTITGNGTQSFLLQGAISDYGGSRALTKSGSSTLVLAGNNTYTGPTTVSNGRLRLQTSLVSSSAVNVTGGTLELATGAAGTRVIKTQTVSVTGSGKLDLKDNKLITASPRGSWNGSAYTGITGLIASGRNSSAWNGNGITTSMSDATSGYGYTMLGVATASEARNLSSDETDTWGGVIVTGSDTLVMYTYGGDANLSGTVDIDDYGQIDVNASLGGILTGWFNGDFDYSGVCDIDDYGVIDSIIGIQGAPFPMADGASLTAVPEPGTMPLLAAVVLATRRRRAGPLTIGAARAKRRF